MGSPFDAEVYNSIVKYSLYDVNRVCIIDICIYITHSYTYRSIELFTEVSTDMSNSGAADDPNPQHL